MSLEIIIFILLYYRGKTTKNNMNIDNILDKKELTEEELDILYSYLDSQIHTMNEEQKNIWWNILLKVDPHFKDGEDD